MTAPTRPPPTYPFAPASGMDPPDKLAELRASEPVSRVEFDGGPAWLLTRHADIRAVLVDPRFAPHIPGVPMQVDKANNTGMLFIMHGAPHGRLRQVLARALSARRVFALRPGVQRLADAALARLTAHGPPADLMRGFAGPLAAGTLSELLGVALRERPGFEEMITGVNALFTAQNAADAAERGQELAAFLARLIAERRTEPGPDLLSELITATDQHGTALTAPEVHGLTFSLLGAGLVPPAQALALGALRLLLDPAAAAALRQEPGRLPTAVEELLRLDPAGAGSTDRAVRAVADVEIAGVRISVGEVVVLPFGAANRDPAEFHEPNTLRLDRATNRHVSFAPGLHHCLGAALARLQLEIGIGTLLAGLPALAVATDIHTLDWQHGMLGARNLATLPVTW
ncbi:MAG: cytochrome P450, partial [Pseudonocardiaceae bacterium]